jgi:two-component system sensor histidine kinase BaeS
MGDRRGDPDRAGHGWDRDRRVQRDEAGVAFRVTDTGDGIPRDELAHVFDRFTRSPESRGSGLGLAIAKSLVQAHGGTISAESEPGRGTTIRFVLPAV